ncbi:MAG: ABC transporter permease [Anaerolineales bacterium]|jgi:peptide/nickel transport system permease protein|nr:ABC transporter permease [Anaerolineales bacterium]
MIPLVHKLADFWRETIKTLKLIARNKMGFVGFILLLLLILMSFVGPLIVQPEVRADITQIYKPPSWAHPLGTDFQGRENWIMLVHGGAEVIEVAFLAGVMTTIIAVIVGAFSAFLGGKADELIMTVTDVWLALPRGILLIVTAYFVSLQDVWALALFLSVFGWPSLARQVRSQFLSLKKREYVEAAQLLNLGTPHILFREMLPNMMSYILIALIESMTGAIYSQTYLVFLGLVPFGNNWGVLFSLAYAKNAIYNTNAMSSLLVPMGGIVLLQLSLIMFSRSLEEIFNPRLRTGV